MFITYEYCELAIMHLCCRFEVLALHHLPSIFSCSYFSSILLPSLLSQVSLLFISTV